MKSSSALLGLAAAALSLALIVPAASSAASPAAVLATGKVVVASAASVQSDGTEPADGRLRGADFMAQVSEVAWPQDVEEANGFELVAGSGHRLVAFTLAVTQPSNEAGELSPSTAVSAAIELHPGQLNVSMDSIDDQIEGGTSESALTTGIGTFAATVPDHDHQVTLELTEGTFSQALNLWTLARVRPAPAVLYRDAHSASVAGTPSTAVQLAFRNPSNGFTSSDATDVSSTQLTWFAPDDSGTTPAASNMAFLVVHLQSTYPDVPVSDPNWGHFFASFNPLPTALLTFTPTGGTAVTASRAPFSTSAGELEDDDGLFDAFYWFTVPASTTTGTLTIQAGQVSGVEYEGFEGQGNNVPISITAPLSIGLTFPAPSTTPAVQHSPSWTHAPLPATGLAAAGGTSVDSQQGSSGFPIWLAVVLLLAVAAAVVTIQRRRGQRGLPSAVSAGGVGADGAAVATSPGSPPPPGPPLATDSAGATTDRLAPEAPRVSADAEANGPPAVPGDLVVQVLGPVEVRGWHEVPERRITEELLCFLVLHDSRPMSAEQIRLAIWPTEERDQEVAPKTFLNYLSTLRRCIGAEHLPDAVGARGYRIQDVESDWGQFSQLVKKADQTSGPEAMALRTQALALVRGPAFEGIPSDQYLWVSNEHWHSTITVAVATCALTLATDLVDQGDFTDAEASARIGLKADLEDFSLWQVGAQAIDAQGDRTGLRRFMADAARHLDAADLQRIYDSLPPHSDSSER
jgi:hypothetical protein